MSNGVNWPAVGCAGVDCMETGRPWGSTTAERRDKRGSPVEPQAIGMAWVLPCRSVGSRAAPCVFNNAIKDIFGTVGALALIEVRP